MMNFGKKMAVGVASAALVASLAGVPAAVAGVNKNPGDEVRFPDGGSFTRISGDSRIDTALAVADRLYKDSGESLKVAYLVSAGQDNMVDAATSGMLKDGVVLLVPADKAGQLLLGATIKSKFPKVKKLVAVGGTKAVSDEAVANVKKMNSNVSTTERLGGKNRYETNVAVAKAAYKTNEINHVYLTRGDQIVDALAAGWVTNGPVLLVNHEGDVDEASKTYYQKLPDSIRSVILGGDGALSDEQASKLGAKHESTDPWTHLKSAAELKAAIQTAAATYYGQSHWQKMRKDGQGFPKRADFDPKKLDKYQFFGQGDTAAEYEGESKNPSDIKTDAIIGSTDKAKSFAGYKVPMKLLNNNLRLLANKHSKLDSDLQNALRNASDVKATDLTSAPNSAGPAKDLWDAVKDMYGLDDAAMKVTMDGSKVSEEGAFAFDEDTLKVTGLNKDLFADIEAKLGGDWDKKKVYRVSGAGKTLGEAAYSVITGDAGNLPNNVVMGSPVTDKLAGVDWDALYNKVKTEQESMNKKTAEAKKALVDAVMAYYNRPSAIVTKSKSGGWDHLAGKNRYETSALLGYYAYGFYLNGKKVEPANGRVYLASGDDAHLVDSVVAGQLTDGPILLVPASGEIDKSVIQHLAYLKYRETNLGTYLIGGKVAVSDEVRDEAVKALRHSKEYAGADALGKANKGGSNTMTDGLAVSKMEVKGTYGTAVDETLDVTFDGSPLPKNGGNSATKTPEIGKTATGNQAPAGLTATFTDDGKLEIKTTAATPAGDHTVKVDDGKGAYKVIKVTIAKAALPSSAAFDAVSKITASNATDATNGKDSAELSLKINNSAVTDAGLTLTAEPVKADDNKVTISLKNDKKVNVKPASATVADNKSAKLTVKVSGLDNYKDGEVVLTVPYQITA
ncbi:cell wall-binding repeat-containing protein [Mobiluncus mulieris]|nr:cell wall-binding repeat-containing protein [Mobiluncus mulieris]